MIVNTIPLRGPLTGVARYVQEIAARLTPQAVGTDVAFYNGIFSDRPRTDIPFASKTPITLTTFHKRCVRSSLYLSLRALGLAQAAARRFDLYFEPNHIPLACVRARRLATTVHDLSVALYPQWHPEKRRRYFHRHFDARAPRSDVLITVSEHVRAQVMDYFALPPERVRAIHNGLDHAVFRPRPQAETAALTARLGLTGPFVLFCGSIEPRKNILGALRAYAALPADLKREFRFVLCGFEGWHNDEVMAAIAAEKDRITYLGYMSDEELAGLYSACAAFVFPSFYEGFGLPPLEAMACGAPVVAARAGSLPEVLGDVPAYADPADEGSIARAMERVLGDAALREDMTRRGISHAARFTWETSAAEHAKLFRELLGGRIL